MRTDKLKTIHQRPIALPMFIPHLPHPYTCRYLFDRPWVSISPYSLIRSSKGSRELNVATPAEVRSLYRLRADARIIFRGSDKDKHLENYWAYRLRDELAAKFKVLDAAVVIGPNYSHFGDVVRTDNMYNRMRQLICLEEMSEAGLNVAPHLNDATASDWDFWIDYLKDNSSVKIIAKEFQTRCKSAREGILAVERLANVQQVLGRELHPIIVGGTQYLEPVAARFKTFSLLDCRPVQDGIHYHRFIPKGKRGKREPDPYLPHIGPDALIDANVRAYEKWVNHRADLATGSRHVGDRRAG